ncbi:MAG: M55 family metallopeptidase [Enterobacteriaceae bacterium]|jgi:D-amino peptidase|nr:M55 family metallopeptidase [Enterobacteriaceae bacterium]
MKILISTDIEGVAGVFHPEQTRPNNSEYERARVWMTNEANAAVCGAFDGGAKEVIVNDSHGSFRNIIADKLDPRARLLQGKPRYLSMVSGVETSPNALFMIGYHAKAKSRGILAHTINGFAFARIWLNDIELGEAGLYGALAGEFNVPVAMICGDNIFIEETLPLFPNVTSVETKQAEGQNSGLSLTPEASCQAIYNAARMLIEKPAQWQPYRITPPVTCRLQTQTPALADLFGQLPIVERLEGDLIQFAAENVQSAIRIINCFSAMSMMLR